MKSKHWIGLLMLIGLTGCQSQQDVRIVAVDAQSGERIHGFWLSREVILKQPPIIPFHTSSRMDNPPSERDGQPAPVNFRDKTTVLVRKQGYTVAEIEYSGGTFWVTAATAPPTKQDDLLLQLANMDDVPKPKSTGIAFARDGTLTVRLYRLPEGYMTRNETIAEIFTRLLIMNNPKRKKKSARSLDGTRRVSPRRIRIDDAQTPRRWGPRVGLQYAPMLPAKFCHLEHGEHIPHDYGNVYFEHPCGPSSRLVIGPSKDHVELMTELAAELKGQPWYVLYVLLVPRQGNRGQGRYQSQPFETHAELSTFLSSFKSYFETDGRHHVWVGSVANDGLLVYDQHNVIFGYGPLDRFKAILNSRGFREREFWFPAPHSHCYEPENDAEEERLMSEVEWQHSPLQPGDEWE